MKRAGVLAYRAVLRLVRRLPQDTRPYYSKFARENFVNYRDVDDPKSVPELLHRAYDHSVWVLRKYSIDPTAANALKRICRV